MKITIFKCKSAYSDRERSLYRGVDCKVFLSYYLLLIGLIAARMHCFLLLFIVLFSLCSKPCWCPTHVP